MDAASLGSFAFVGGGIMPDVFATRGWILMILLGVAATLAVVRLAQRRIGLVVPALALIAASAVLSRLLKGGLLARPDFGDFSYAENTFPSGHVTVSIAAAIAICWLLPGMTRGSLVLVLFAAAICVALFSVWSFAHRASDIVGGALLAGFLAATMNAVTRRSRPEPLWMPAVIAAAGATTMTVVASVAVGTSSDAAVTGLIGAAFVLTAFAAVSAVMVSEARVRPVFVRKEHVAASVA